MNRPWLTGGQVELAGGLWERGREGVCVYLCVCAGLRTPARRAGQRGQLDKCSSGCQVPCLGAHLPLLHILQQDGVALHSIQGQPGLGQSVGVGSSHGWHLLKWRVRRSLELCWQPLPHSSRRIYTKTPHRPQGPCRVAP